MARDKFHDVVRDALVKDGWEITHDPLAVEFSALRQVFIDLGAEKLLTAHKGERKIAVEIKSFIGVSLLQDLYGALGQFMAYRTLLKEQEPNRKLYLAVPKGTYEGFMSFPSVQGILKDAGAPLIVYDIEKEVIATWLE